MDQTRFDLWRKPDMIDIIGVVYVEAETKLVKTYLNGCDIWRKLDRNTLWTII